MSDKFLGSGQGSINLSNGSATIYSATLGASSLKASKPIKTNSVKQLISTNLDIADVNNLQTQLNEKDELTFVENDTHTTPASGKNKIYFKTDGNLYKKDALDVESLIGGGGVSGPPSSVDNAVVFFDGTRGQVIKEISNFKFVTGVTYGDQLKVPDIETDDHFSINGELTTLDASITANTAKLVNQSAVSTPVPITTLEGELDVAKIKSYQHNCELQFDNMDATLIADETVTILAPGISLSGTVNVAGTILTNQTSFSSDQELITKRYVDDANNLQNTAIGSNTTKTQNITATAGVTTFTGTIGSDNVKATSEVAIGTLAGENTQGSGSVAIGAYAGNNTQGTNSVAIGNNAGNLGQQNNSVAIGYEAGLITQGDECVSIGLGAGRSGQVVRGVAIGRLAGENTQGNNAVALGWSSGNNTQGSDAIAIGTFAGSTTQQNGAIGIGDNAGRTSQGTNGIAIGSYSGNTGQGANSISIGKFAGLTSQGANSIAIGENAGYNNQSNNSIILNASGETLDASSSGLFVAPIVNKTTAYPLFYNPITSEITHKGINSTFVLEEDAKFNQVETFPAGSSKYGCAVLGDNDNKIYGIPYDANHVLEFDYTTNAVTNTYAVPAGNDKYMGAVLHPNGKIYCSPLSATHVLEFDPVSKSVNSTFGTSVGGEQYFGAVLHPNGKIYCPPWISTNNILVIDPVAGTTSTSVFTPITYTGGIGYSGGALTRDGKIIFVPFDGRSGILEVDPVAGTTTQYGNHINSPGYSGCVLADNGLIYAVPYSALYVLEIDPYNKDTRDIGFTLNTPVGGWKFRGGVLHPNGNIYCANFATDEILEINPTMGKTREITTGETPTALNFRTAGITLAPNGKMYCLPRSNTYILEVTPPNGIIIPSGRYLSPYYNKF